MGVTVDEYIPLEARVNPNGSVDVLIDGTVVPGGSGLTMASVLQLLSRYAGENGKLLMTTTHPNGSVTRDLVDETGEVTPFYPEVKPRAVTAGVTADPSEDALLQVLKQSGRRRVGYSEIVSAPVPPAAPATTRVKMGEGAIPKYDVEADIQKTLSSKKPPATTKQRLIVAAVILTLLALAIIALAGMPLISAATHMLGALTPAGASVPDPQQL
jgi:hypothetical protein